jgi:anti-sigma factor RsiW
MNPNNEITDVDLNAYVDEQLDPARRAEVESYLSEHQKAAALVMQDLSVRANLRMAFAVPTDRPDAETLVYARRLQSGLRRGPILHHLARIAAILLLLVTGWLARGEIGRILPQDRDQAFLPSVLIFDAVRAHDAALLRSTMHSMPVSIAIDRKEISATTHIVIPDLPDDWRLLDTEVFPSDEGPSVELEIDAGKLGIVSLFAVQSNTPMDTVPDFVTEGTTGVAYWQEGALAYALVGKVPKSALLDAISKLKKSKVK